MPNQELLTETKKLMRQVNLRLNQIEKEYGKAGKWAGKSLQKKVKAKVESGISATGRLKANKQMSDSELRYINYQARQFLKKKTSTIKGIKEASENIKRGIYERAGEEVTKEDVEKFYDLLDEDERYTQFTEIIGASDVWVAIREATESRDSINDFAHRLNTYARFYEGESGTVFDDLPDSDIKDEIEELYNKYVKK